jgi:uncharacterized RDD family membrane protein YckC
MNTHGAQDLVVDSVTGVALALPVAGPGARCYAFLIDWLIRSILFTAWYGIAALIYNGRWSFIAPLTPDAKWFVLVVTPAAAMYFLYHLVLEIAMHGRTPGKRVAGVHIVARDGSSPGVGALLTRNVFRLIDSLPVCYGVGLLATLVARDHVRIGDMAAGTLLAYERDDVVLLPHPTVPRESERGRGPGIADAEIAHDLLSRWPSLEVEARRRLATAVLERYGLSVRQETDASLRSQLERIAQAPPA